MGTLLNGKYYKNPEDVPQQTYSAISQQVQGYDREHSAKKYDRELIQPWLPDGSPNPEFIKHYPKEAKEYGMELI